MSESGVSESSGLGQRGRLGSSDRGERRELPGWHETRIERKQARSLTVCLLWGKETFFSKSWQ